MGTRGTRGTQFLGLRNQAVRMRGKRGKSRLGALFAKPTGEPAEVERRILARRRGTDADRPLSPPISLEGNWARRNPLGSKPSREGLISNPELEAIKATPGHPPNWLQNKLLDQQLD